MLYRLICLMLLVGCQHELTYKDEICYDKCLEQSLYVLKDSEDECICGKLKND